MNHWWPFVPPTVWPDVVAAVAAGVHQGGLGNDEARMPGGMTRGSRIHRFFQEFLPFLTERGGETSAVAAIGDVLRKYVSRCGRCRWLRNAILSNFLIFSFLVHRKKIRFSRAFWT